MLMNSQKLEKAIKRCNSKQRIRDLKKLAKEYPTKSWIELDDILYNQEKSVKKISD